MKGKAECLGIQHRVSFEGWVNGGELKEWYRRSRIVVVPSLREGLGMVIIEALGEGSIVVASDLSAIKEVVEHNITGVLFKRGELDSLSQALVYALRNQEQIRSKSKDAIQLLRARFDWASVAKSYLDLIDTV